MELDEPFLDDSLRRHLPELVVGRCAQCGSLWALDARIESDVLMEAYQRMPHAYFEPQISPRYGRFYRRIEALAKKYVSGKRILDLGCGDGTFLSTISSDWQKQGLEPSRSGADLARQKHLEVTCGTLVSSAQNFEVDLLAVLDVIEHVVDPHAFVESLKSHLRAHGVVLILTGDPDSLVARIAGNQWSYLRWCGHVSVLSRQALTQLMQEHGFEVVEWQRCEHPSTPGLLAWWRVHLLEPARRLLGRNKSWYPLWRDHQLLIARLL
jgi:SAM-dependent methyltransferase